MKNRSILSVIISGLGLSLILVLLPLVECATALSSLDEALIEAARRGAWSESRHFWTKGLTLMRRASMAQR